MGIWPLYRALCQQMYLQVGLAIALGIIVGYLYPPLGVSMKPLGDAFVKLNQMMVSLIVFTNVVLGLAMIGDLKTAGRIGLKALLYFEGVTTIALILGLVAATLLQLGTGMHVDPRTANAEAMTHYTPTAHPPHGLDLLVNVIPSTVVDAFAKGNILQVLLVAVLFGLALVHYGEQGRSLVVVLEQVNHCLFIVVRLIMRVAPLGAFGAMAFTIGQYGMDTLFSLGKLVAAFYTTCLVFVCIVLWLIARLTGFSLWQFLTYIKEEIVLVLGTSSSAAALPHLMVKLENLGCPRSVVGLTLSTGYSFNLAGTAIYLSMAAIFLARATDVELDPSQQLALLGVLLLTSKGAAAVTGGGFIALAATLSSTGAVPMEGLALLIGVDQFLAAARAVTNLIGNGVATLVIARWEGALDPAWARAVLAHERLSPV
jgi:aerobic C4-dicarboxylate transport protein